MHLSVLIAGTSAWPHVPPRGQTASLALVPLRQGALWSHQTVLSSLSTSQILDVKLALGAEVKCIRMVGNYQLHRPLLVGMRYPPFLLLGKPGVQLPEHCCPLEPHP